jgi:hypothetical protein
MGLSPLGGEGDQSPTRERLRFRLFAPVVLLI